MNKKTKEMNIIIEAYKYNYKAFLMRVIVIIFCIVLGLIIPITQSEIVNNISNGTFSTALNFLFITLTLVIFEQIFIWLKTRAYWNVKNGVIMFLSNKLIDTTFDNSLYSLSRFNFSLYSNILNTDIEAIGDYSSILITRIILIFELLYVLVYFYIINPLLGFVSTIGLLINIFVIFLFRKKITKFNSINLSTTDDQINMIDDIFHGIKDIKNLNITDNVLNQYDEVTKKSINGAANIDLINSTLKKSNMIIIEIIRHIIYAIGIYLIINGEMELGTILIIYSYFSKIVNFSSVLSDFLTNTVKIKVAIGRYNKIFEYIHKNPKNDYNHVTTGDITFSNIVYGNINNPKLKDVSLTFKENEITIINGDVESGVDGVFELLNKYNYQHSGFIKINDIDISKFYDSEYKSNIATVDKEPMFFNISIKDNLLLICDDIEFIISISKLLGVHYYILALTNGYDTILENDCSNVQFKLRYLLEILRVFLCNPKIILFDDIFDVLDQDDIDNLINLINELKNEKTIIIRTANEKIINLTDNIIIFKDGNVSKKEVLNHDK